MNLPTLAVVVVAAGEPAASLPPPASQLTLTLEVDRTTTTAHAPIQAWFTLRNESSESAEGVFDVGVTRGGTVIEFGRVGAAPSALAYLDQRTVPSADGDPGKTEYQNLRRPRRRTLARGKGITGSVILGMDPRQRTFLLENVGEYQLRATTLDPVAGVRLASNAVRIVVRRPAASEQGAQEAFTPDLALLVQDDLPVENLNGELLRAAGAFLDRFGSSDYAFLLRRGLKRALSLRSGAKEVALARRLAREERLSPAVPPGGRERAAYDALTPELEMILQFGDKSGGALGLSTSALVDAARFVERFGGTTYAPIVKDRLEMLLKIKAHAGTIKPEGKSLLESLTK